MKEEDTQSYPLASMGTLMHANTCAHMYACREMDIAFVKLISMLLILCSSYEEPNG